MKKVSVEAKVPENKEKGTKELAALVSVNFAENVKELVEMFGEEAILTNCFANWRVTLQSNIRAGLRKGESGEAIATRLASAKMGVASTGAKVDPIQAYLATFQNSSPDEQKKMMADLAARAAKK